MVLLSLIIIPVIATAISLLVRKKTWPLELVAGVAGSAELLAVLIIALKVVADGQYAFGSIFLVDALGLIVMLIVALVGCAAAFYSIGYLRAEVAKQIIGFHRVRQFFILLQLFLMAMFFGISTVNPVLMWVAIEATTLATAFLISFYNKSTAMEAAWKYLIINSVGLLLAFFGTLLFLAPLARATGGAFVNWHTLLANVTNMNPSIVKMAFVLVLVGYGTKVGLAPMHTWLPDAHSKAPSPISALLSGALLNVALLAVLRFKVVADGVVGVSFSQNLLIFFGFISVAIPAFIIITQKNYKRLFAYSSIEHMGIAALGFGFGGLGSFAALLHMLYHSLTKSVLFFSAGNVFLKFGSTKLANISGVLKVLSTTGVVLILGFLAITGVPPFGIFYTELSILSAGVSNHLVVVIFVLLFLALAFIGFLRHISKMVYGEAPAEMKTGEVNYWTIIPPIALISLLIIGSIYLPASLKFLINSAVAVIR